MSRGPNDPERPRRIALAALWVVQEYGVESLTHRRVAARAEVPLGSTTYYFKTVDALLAVAIGEAKRAADAEVETWAQTLGDGSELPDRLAELIVGNLRDHWSRTVMELELYMAALRRPQLRGLSREWAAGLTDVVAQYVDASTARAWGVVTDGLYMRAMTHGLPTVEEIREILERTVR